MNEILELEIQKKIYSLVLKNPGLNLSKIAEFIGISIQLADYHLHYLERNGLVDSIKQEGYNRYYTKGDIGSRDKKYLSLFRQETLLKIVLFLLKNPYARHREIMDYLQISKSLLSYHLKKHI